MKFGPVPVDRAEGALLAHSLRLKRGRLRKGHRLTADDLSDLASAGYREIVVARLDADDLTEDAAAERLALALANDTVAAGTPGTGRCNLSALADGLLLVDRAAIDRLNGIDEGITLSTLAPSAPVRTGQMIATVKIIPLGVAASSVSACVEAASASLRIAPFRSLSAALVQTRLPGIKPSLLEKTVEATRRRLDAIGSTLDATEVHDHSTDAVASALKSLAGRHELVLLLGASAIIDRRDVIPSALVEAGGEILHFGMPVDPGNLTLIGRIGETWVLGLPGSARSPRAHGFDWVLQRIAAGLGITGAEIAAMGVGGLLKEVPGRPLPRATATRQIPEDAPSDATPRKIAAVILAAGQSRRMGPENKLLIEIDGVPMIRHAVRAVRESLGPSADLVVVTGHEAERVRRVLADENVAFVHNPDFADGLSTSLRAGVAALPDTAEAALVALGDMPGVDAAMIARLVEAFDPDGGKDIVLPVHHGKRGNPVLWGRRHFADMAALTGDVGARHLIGENADAVAEVEIGDAAILTDLDTPDAVARYRDRPRGGVTGG